MYSGTTLTKYSGRVLGTHQKIDKVARKNLEELLKSGQTFPSYSKIIDFEGRNGPDAIKRKSPAKDEPWHYFDPFDDNQTDLVDQIKDHYDQLSKYLQKANNSERSAFEAAWLAHAIVDGLTPAHHYPYESELLQIRGGAHNHTRDTIFKKIVMPGITIREKIINNWKMWGPGGLMTSHGLFEMGIAMILLPLSLNDSKPSKKDIERAKKIGIEKLFVENAKKIAKLGLYDSYRRKSWTPHLAWEVRHKLGPIIVKTLTLSWYLALNNHKLEKEKIKKS